MRSLPLLLAALVFAGCFGSAPEGSVPPPPDDARSAPLAEAALRLGSSLDGFASPVHLTHAGDGSGRAFVVEQEGRVRVVEPGGGGGAARTWLEVSDRVGAGGERGLLGLAFAPDFDASGVFWLHYTDRAGDTVLARYRTDAAGLGDAASEEVVLTVDQPFANHNGGMIAFGPDGKLWLALGDGGGAGDPGNRAQDPGTLLGKLVRVDPESGEAEVAALGLRNPWRIAFDRATGDLWIGDVGQSAREEIDRWPSEAEGVPNFGWNVWEGTRRFRPGDAASEPVFPVWEYDTGDGRCAVTGGPVVRTPSLPALQGLYLFADYCSGEIWALGSEEGRWEAKLLLDTELRISSFGEDEAGGLWVVDHGGAVWRLEPS